MPELTADEIKALRDGATPGPWKTAQTTIHGIGYGGLWVELSNDSADEDQPMIQISGSGGARSFTMRVIDIQRHDDNDANARLIAAAHDLADTAIAALDREAQLIARVAELEAEVQRVKSDRAYIIGANDGWEAAAEQGETSDAVKSAMVRFWKKLAKLQQSRVEAEIVALRAQLATARAETWEAAADVAGKIDHYLNGDRFAHQVHAQNVAAALRAKAKEATE